MIRIRPRIIGVKTRMNAEVDRGFKRNKVDKLHISNVRIHKYALEDRSKTIEAILGEHRMSATYDTQRHEYTIKTLFREIFESLMTNEVADYDRQIHNFRIPSGDAFWHTPSIYFKCLDFPASMDKPYKDFLIAEIPVKGEIVKIHLTYIESYDLHVEAPGYSLYRKYDKNGKEWVIEGYDLLPHVAKVHANHSLAELDKVMEYILSDRKTDYAFEEFYEKWRSLKLNINYYREFNHNAGFNIHYPIDVILGGNLPISMAKPAITTEDADKRLEPKFRNKSMLLSPTSEHFQIWPYIREYLNREEK